MKTADRELEARLQGLGLGSLLARRGLPAFASLAAFLRRETPTFSRRFERSGRRPHEGPGVGRAARGCAEGVWGGVGAARRILEGPKQGARAHKRSLDPARPENARGRGARTPPLPLIVGSGGV